LSRDFEWDHAKEAANFEKHGLTFSDAGLVWRDINRTEEVDPRQDYGETRLRTTGHYSSDTLLTVVFTMRGHRIRIISARKANKNERRKYRQSKT